MLNGLLDLLDFSFHDLPSITRHQVRLLQLPLPALADWLPDFWEEF